MPVKKEDQEKSAFISYKRLNRFTRMPFELKNSPGALHRATDIILAKVKWKLPMVYLKDIIFYSDNVPRHYTHLR